MKEILINKDKAIEKERTKAIAWFFMGTILWTLLIGGCWAITSSLEYDSSGAATPIFKIFGFVFVFMVIYEVIQFQILKIKIKSLQQEYDTDELMTKYKIIVQTKSSARLQVVNNVNITQSIWDKFYDFFNVEIDYGFSDQGYSHKFHYLEEKQAEEIQKTIKPHSRLGINLNEK
jgi:uncharacterized membrane protein YdbT with pleckstrin-like domain